MSTIRLKNIVPELDVIETWNNSNSDNGTFIKRYQTVDGTTDSVVSDTATETGVSQTGSSTSITLAAGANAVDDYYNGWWLYITSGTGSGQVRRIKDYNGTTKIADIYSNSDSLPEGADFATSPDATSNYSLFSKTYINSFYDESVSQWKIGYSAETNSNITTQELANLTVNDFTVLGAFSNGGLTSEGQFIVDETNTEAVIVRKDGDSGDIFIIDTTNGIVTLNNTLNFTDTGTPLINMQSVSSGPPAFTTRSDGTKIVLYDTLSATHVDYGIGVGSVNDLWCSVPQNTSLYNFNWFAGTTKIMDLRGDGTLIFNTTTGTPSAGAINIGYNTGSRQITFQRADNDYQAFIYVASDNDFHMETSSGGGNIVLKTNIGSVDVESKMLIDITNTEAFLVRKDADSGDVFIVDTTNTRVGIGKTPSVALDVEGTARVRDTLVLYQPTGGGDGGQIVLGFPGADITAESTSSWNIDVDSSNNLRFFVSGSDIALSFSSATGKATFDGCASVDCTDTEAFLVRKNADGGDIFTVDTTNSRILFGDANFYNNFNGTDPVLVFDSNDSIQFDRSANKYLFRVAASNKLTIDESTIVSEVQHIVDSTSTEAFLVRKETDGGDVFKVDTTNEVIGMEARVSIFGSKSGTPSAAGSYLRVNNGSSTFTDDNTAGSGTAAIMSFNSFGAPTLAATNTSVTTTDASTLYIAGAPIAGTNQTITNSYALWVDSGKTRLDGDTALDGNLRIDYQGDGVDAISFIRSDDVNNTGISLIGTGADTKIRLKSLSGARGRVFIYDGTSDYVQFNSVDGSSMGCTLLIEKTDTEAFLVRKDSDAGDVFTVDTTNSSVQINNPADTSPLAIGYNAGTQVFLERNGGGGGLSMFIDASNHANISNGSGASNIVLKTNSFGKIDFHPSNTLSARIDDAFVQAIGTGFFVFNNRTSNDSRAYAMSAYTFTDDTTVASGTSADRYTMNLAANTIAATNTSVTTTNASTLYIEGAPIAGTNQTITNSYALWVDSGNVLFDGDLTVVGSLVADSVTYETVIIDSTNTEAFLVRKNSDSGDVFTIDTTNDIVKVNETFTVNVSTGTPTTGALNIGYNSGNTQIALQRTDGSFTAHVIRVESDNSLKIANFSGGGAINFSTTIANFDSKVVIDDTNTEAFLVRKDSDSGDVFVVDTTNDVILIEARTSIFGNKSGTPSAAGSYLRVNNGTNTFTDDNTAGSGTAAIMSFNSFGAPTLAATNTLVTTTDAATVYVAGAPIAGTNQTITNSYALWVDSGNVKFDGDLTVSGSLVADSVTYETIVVDSTNTEALLVRKDSDGGDIFTVDTTNSLVKVQGTGDSTSSTTGALIVDGGVGIAKKLFVGGILNCDFQGSGSDALRFQRSDLNYTVISMRLVNDELVLRNGTGGKGRINFSNAVVDYFKFDSDGSVTVSPLTVEKTSIEALLVRKDTDSGDVFTVDTTNSITTVKTHLVIDGNQNYEFDGESGAGIFTNHLSIQSQTAATNSLVGFYTKDSDGTDDNIISIFASGAPTASSNYSRMVLGYDQSEASYLLVTDIDGTGTNYPITIETSGNNNQLKVNTNGSVTLSNNTASTGAGSGTLQVTGGAYFGNSSYFDGNVVVDNTSTEAFLVRKDSDSGDVFNVDTTNSRVSINSLVAPTGKLNIGHNAGTTQIFLERDGGGGGLSMYVDASNHAVISNGSGASDIILSTNSFGTIDFTPSGVLSARIVEGSIQAVAAGYNVFNDRTGDESTAYTMNAYTFTDDTTAASGTSATDRHTMNLLANTIAATNTTVTTTNAATLYIAGAPIAGTNQTITNPYALWVDSGNTRLDGDLTVLGSLVADSVTYETVIVDSTNTEALLVRKDADSGDIFTVDTTNSRVLFGDLNFYNNFNGTDPGMVFDSNDSIQFDRSANQYLFRVASSNKLTIDANTIVSEVQHIVDSTGTEAFLVRKETDGGDVFTVDTTNSKVYINGEDITPSTGVIAATDFSASNNIGSPTNVTGFEFAEASVRSFKALVTIVIDATADLYSQVELRGLQKATGVWVMSANEIGDASNVNFTIASDSGNGQIRYTSGNEAGFVSSTFTFSTTEIHNI